MATLCSVWKTYRLAALSSCRSEPVAVGVSSVAGVCADCSVAGACADCSVAGVLVATRGVFKSAAASAEVSWPASVAVAVVASVGVAVAVAVGPWLFPVGDGLVRSPFSFAVSSASFRLYTCEACT